jgi:peroxiredoxin-like protein
MEHLYSYHVSGIATAALGGTVSAEEIQPAITFSAPPEFCGQTGLWTPEHLLLASVAGCFISTFSGMAQYSKFPFLLLNLDVEGTIEKNGEGWRFVRIVLRPQLKIAQDDREYERAERLLEKAERNCLVTRSLACPVTMEPAIETVEEAIEFVKAIPVS